MCCVAALQTKSFFFSLSVFPSSSVNLHTSNLNKKKMFFFPPPHDSVSNLSPMCSCEGSWCIFIPYISEWRIQQVAWRLRCMARGACRLLSLTEFHWQVEVCTAGYIWAETQVVPVPMIFWFVAHLSRTRGCLSLVLAPPFICLRCWKLHQPIVMLQWRSCTAERRCCCGGVHAAAKSTL